jgi:MOSC domain-containing protein YiiM
MSSVTAISAGTGDILALATSPPAGEDFEMSDPVVLSIQVGRPVTMGDEAASEPMDRRWTSGIVKQPVSGRVWVGCTNLEGDGQADVLNHGGREKAVLAYAAGHYPAWREELGRPDLPFGAFGENLTIDGLDETSVCIGDVYAVGGAKVQVSQPRKPCWKLARRWNLKDLPVRVQQTGRGGWYLRVLGEGFIEPGNSFALRERPCPRWTVSLANDLFYRRRGSPEDLAGLAECPLLSPNWRDSLGRRISGKTDSDPRGRLIGPNEDD